MTAPPPPPPEQKHLNLNLDYFKTPVGQLRIAQGALSLAALISSVEGQCLNDASRYGFFLFVIIITMIEAILIILVFVLQLDKKVKTTVNIPLSLLMNDSISLLFYFINCTLSMLSIGRCPYLIEARVITTLFAIALFLVYIGLIYTDYKWWQTESNLKEASNNGSTTVTESSPTVLT